MKRIFTLAALAALCIGAVSCHRDKTPKISIFCDHIETIARQEGISFAEPPADGSIRVTTAGGSATYDVVYDNF